MDFDLFDDEDDDLLTSVMMQPEECECTLQLVSDLWPELCCSGSDAQRERLVDEGFVRSGFVNKIPWNGMAVSANITLGAYKFSVPHMYSHLNVKFLFDDICKNVQYLYACVRYGNVMSSSSDMLLSFYQRRRQVTTFLLLLLYTGKADDRKTVIYSQLHSFRHLLNRIAEVDTWKLIYFANSTVGNECNVPAYHLLHGLLEWKFLDLCLLQKFESTKALEATLSSEDYVIKSVFIFQLKLLVRDLLLCSFYIYKKSRSTDLLSCSPFVCVCVKEIWLLLQLVMEKWYVPDEDDILRFWKLFNEVMDELRNTNEIQTLAPLAYCEFSNWIMSALTCLYGYRTNGQYEGPLSIRASSENIENYSLCERCTQEFLQQQPNEEQLRIYIRLLMPTLLQWWQPNVSIQSLLWEYFQKRLNSSFYMASEVPANLAVACNNGRSYVDRYRILLQNINSTTKRTMTSDVNLSSFTLFVELLGKSMERLQQAQYNHQCLKLLGRIYTKFSVQKFLALNETGLHHLIELFLVLLLSGDFMDLAPKFRDKLLSIKLEKLTSARQMAVTKGHMAMLLLHAEYRCDMGVYIGKLLQQLLEVRNDHGVSKIIAESLPDLFTLADNFSCGEHLLIDAWLTNFLSNCTACEQERTFEALHIIFTKMRNHKNFINAGSDDGGHGSELFKALNIHVLPYLKQQYACSYSSWMPQLAADFCIHNFLMTDIQSFKRLFQYFHNTQVVNKQSMPQFILKVLESERVSIVEPIVVMQVWLKSLVLLSALNEDVIKLTRYVVELKMFQFMTGLDADAVLCAKEPLCVFVSAVGKQYNACNEDYERRCKIVDNFNECIQNFDRWLLATASNNNAKTKNALFNDIKLEKNDVTFRFYSFLAIVIYNCPQIVYIKSKITCFFHVAMTRFVLPASVQMGKQPEVKLAQIMHKIWPVLMQGIGRLSFKTDPYVAKALNDLIQKWTPHFKISQDAKVVARPFVLCMRCDNHDLQLIMFERLTTLFLATQRRQVNPNACMVITIFNEILKDITTDVNATDAALQECRLETLMKGTCLTMLEHIMMVDEVVPSRGMLYEFFRLLTANSIYTTSKHLQELLVEQLRTVTKKHLAYYTFFYFDLLTILVKISLELVENIIPFLLSEIQVVEKKRGAGEDNRIRACLLKLRDTMSTISAPPTKK